MSQESLQLPHILDLLQYSQARLAELTEQYQQLLDDKNWGRDVDNSVIQAATRVTPSSIWIPERTKPQPPGASVTFSINDDSLFQICLLLLVLAILFFLGFFRSETNTPEPQQLSKVIRSSDDTKNEDGEQSGEHIQENASDQTGVSDDWPWRVPSVKQLYSKHEVCKRYIRALRSSRRPLVSSRRRRHRVFNSRCSPVPTPPAPDPPVKNLAPATIPPQDTSSEPANYTASLNTGLQKPISTPASTPESGSNSDPELAALWKKVPIHLESSVRKDITSLRLRPRSTPFVDSNGNYQTCGAWALAGALVAALRPEVTNLKEMQAFRAEAYVRILPLMELDDSDRAAIASQLGLSSWNEVDSKIQSEFLSEDEMSSQSPGVKNFSINQIVRALWKVCEVYEGSFRLAIAQVKSSELSRLPICDEKSALKAYDFYEPTDAKGSESKILWLRNVEVIGASEGSQREGGCRHWEPLVELLPGEQESTYAG